MIKVNDKVFWVQKNDENNTPKIVLSILDSEGPMYELGKLESEIWLLISKSLSWNAFSSEVKLIFSKKDQDYNSGTLSCILKRYVSLNFITLPQDAILESNASDQYKVIITEIDIGEDLAEGDVDYLKVYATCASPCTCTRIK